MNTPSSRRRIGLIIAIIAAATLTDARRTRAEAPQRISVELSSGRTFTGLVDPATDASKLVMRFEGLQTKLWRPIAWTQIVSAEVDGRNVTSDQLKTMAPELTGDASDEDAEPDDPSPSSNLVDGDEPAVPPVAQIPNTISNAAKPHEPENRRVHSLQIDASLGHWASGVESDGLLVRAVALDAWGHAVPIRGTLEVRLIGGRPSAYRSKYTHLRGDPFPQLGRWVRTLSAENGPGRYFFELPFQAKHPDFDTWLASYALVHARLVVPGAGVFEDTEPLVRIREYSPLRDYRQQLTGQRFFPQERVERTQ
jgi:hypothetical protein